MTPAIVCQKGVVIIRIVLLWRIEALIKESSFNLYLFGTSHEIIGGSSNLLGYLGFIANVKKAFHVVGREDDWEAINSHVVYKLIAEAC